MLPLSVIGCTFTPAEPSPDAEITSGIDAAGKDANIDPPDVDEPSDGGFVDSGTVDLGLSVQPDAGVVCGDGVVFPGVEGCDDGNIEIDDGCIECRVTEGWQCDGRSPTTCEVKPVVSLTGTTAIEGSIAIVRAELSPPSRLFEVSFDWSTVTSSEADEANDNDFVAVRNATVVVPQRQRFVDLEVEIVSDGELEPRERFFVEFERLVAAEAGQTRVAVDIEDDSLPTDDGAVSRYYFEGPGPNGPNEVVDDRGALPLTVVHDKNDPDFYEDSMTGGGLVWDDGGKDEGRAEASLDNTLVRNAVDGNDQLTLEAVVNITKAEGSGSYIIMIGDRSHVTAAMMIRGNQQACWVTPMGSNPCWEDTGIVNGGRKVVAMVFDSRPAAIERLTLYIDGDDFGAPVSHIPPVGETLSVQAGALLIIGNNAHQERSIEGRIGYATIYDRALHPTELDRNAKLLGVRDDP